MNVRGHSLKRENTPDWLLIIFLYDSLLEGVKYDVALWPGKTCPLRPKNKFMKIMVVIKILPIHFEKFMFWPLNASLF